MIKFAPKKSRNKSHFASVHEHGYEFDDVDNCCMEKNIKSSVDTVMANKIDTC